MKLWWWKVINIFLITLSFFRAWDRAMNKIYGTNHKIRAEFMCLKTDVVGFYTLYFHFWIPTLLRSSIWFACNCFRYFVSIIMNIRVLFPPLIKLVLLIKREKEKKKKKKEACCICYTIQVALVMSPCEGDVVPIITCHLIKFFKGERWPWGSKAFYCLRREVTKRR